MGSGTKKLVFLIWQTEKIHETHENGSVNGLSAISGEFSSLIAFFLGATRGADPSSSALQTGLPAGPAPPESTGGVFGMEAV